MTAYSTPPEMLGLTRLALLGRKEEMQRIQRAFQNVRRAHKAQVIFLEGRGGVGKTHLLLHLGTIVQENKGQISEILDLDNPEYAQPVTLLRGLLIALAGGRWENIAPSLRTQWEEFHRSLRRDEPNHLQKKWNHLEKALYHLFRKKTHVNPFAGGLMLRLDTAEWLREDPRLYQPQKTSAYPWETPLLTWLLRRVIFPLGNEPILWVLAGRPAGSDQEDVLWQQLQALASRGIQVERIPLETFPPKEAYDYLKAVADVTEGHDPLGTTQIREYLAKTTPEALGATTDGFPLHLALIADALRLGIPLPEFPKANRILRAKAKVAQGKEDVFLTIGRKLLSTWRSARSGMAYLLERMARVRLGVSEKMLHAWYQEARKEKGLAFPEGWEEQQVLDRLRTLVVVKHFPHRTRAYFLHDEIYRLYNTLWPPTKEERGEILQPVLAEYDDEAKALRFQLMQGEIAARALYHQSEAERIYYRLWLDPWKGYADYLAKANDWAKGEPVAFYRLLRYTARLQHWMTQVEGQQDKDTQAFWAFLTAQQQIFEAILVAGRYGDLKKAKALWASLVEVEKHPSPGKEILFALQALTGALLAYYAEDQPREKTFLAEAKKRIDELPPDVSPLIRELLTSIWANQAGMLARREGRMRRARGLYHQALKALRRYHLSGTAGVLINLAYLEILLDRDRTAEDLLTEARRFVRMNQDKKAEIRLSAVTTLLHASRGQQREAESTALQVLHLCRQEDYPRFRTLTLIHWANALRGEWNRLTVREGSFKQGIQENLAPALRLLIPREQAVRALTSTPWEMNVIALWKRSYGSGFTKSAWDLRKALQPEEETQLFREIGRLWREWAWAWRRLGHAEEQPADSAWEAFFRTPLTRAGADALWQAAMGDNTIPQTKWWQDEERDTYQKKLEQRLETISPFWPLAALVDLAWHYHYHHVLSLEEEVALCDWIWARFPEAYRVPLPNWRQAWPPEAERSETVVPDDPRLLGQLGKLWMLKGHSYLRQFHKASPIQKGNLLHEAVEHIALALEYDHLLGKHSSGLRRAEANLHDWLLQYSLEPFDSERSLLDAFLGEVKQSQKNCPSECHLYKFISERFG